MTSEKTTPKNSQQQNSKAAEPDTIYHKNIYEALAAFQAEVPPISKDGVVEFKTNQGPVKFNYATLGNIMKTILPILGKHGLSIRHAVNTDSVEAILTYTTSEVKKEKLVSKHTKEIPGQEGTAPQVMESNDEERLEFYEQEILRSGKLPINTAKGDMKDVGAQITYARRYTLSVVLGIATEEDKDATLINAEEQAQNLKSYAYNSIKTRIERCQTAQEVESVVGYINEELDLISNNKKPKVQLTKAEFEELAMIAQQQKVNIQQQEAEAKVEKELAESEQEEEEKQTNQE